MLHIPGILDCTYHLHVSCLCAQGSSIAEYLDYSRSCKKRHLRACVPVRFARVHTPKLHLRGGGTVGFGPFFPKTLNPKTDASIGIAMIMPGWNTDWGSASGSGIHTVDDINPALPIIVKEYTIIPIV